MCVDAVFGAGSVEAELDVLAIHRGAVVEGDAIVKLERVFQAIIGDFPALGQAGDDRSVGGKTGEPLENIGISYRIDGAGSGAGRVEMRRFELHGDGDAGLRLCGSEPCGKGKRAGERQFREFGH